MKFEKGSSGIGVYVGRYYIGFHLPLIDWYWWSGVNNGKWLLVCGPLLVYN